MKINFSFLIFISIINITINQANAQSISNDTPKLFLNPHTNSLESVEKSKQNQVLVNSKNENIKAPLNEECRTGFWSVDANGDIKKWDLINNSISGGSLVLSGSGTGLSYCGGGQAQTFHSTIWTLGAGSGMKYYNFKNSWTTILNNLAIIKLRSTG